MNTCLTNLYLKLHQIDSRYIRLALIIFSFIGGGYAMGIPIHGDVGS